MQKYIVIALSLGGLNNKIYDSGDIVGTDCFPEGHAEELVKKGFLKSVKENTNSPSEEEAKAKAEAEELAKLEAEKNAKEQEANDAEKNKVGEDSGVANESTQEANTRKPQSSRK
jgi:hypothetical protein